MRIEEAFDFLKTLAGQWKVTRMLDTLGNARGIATFRVDQDNHILYNESLTLHLSGHRVIKNATQHYVFEYLADQQKLLKYYYQNEPAELVFGENDGHIVASTVYQCQQDEYKAVYEFYDHDHFKLIYTASGPNKNHRIESEFYRIPPLCDIELLGTFGIATEDSV